jgi:serine protease Do
MGIVGGNARYMQIPNTNSTIKMIQHDAVINPGNSGGPLFNMDGEILGINAMKVFSAAQAIEVMGFSISGDIAQRVAEDIEAYGSVKRAYLGVSVVDLREVAGAGTTLTTGLYITYINPGSPADGVFGTNDIIVRVNGVDVFRPFEFADIIFQHKPGDTVEFSYYKRSQNYSTLHTVSIVLTELT